MDSFLAMFWRKKNVMDETIGNLLINFCLFNVQFIVEIIGCFAISPFENYENAQNSNSQMYSQRLTAEDIRKLLGLSQIVHTNVSKI